MKTLTSKRKTWLISVLTAIFVLALSFAVTSFTGKSAFAEETALTGISGINVSLQEDIVVKIHTDATTDDGTKLVVAYNGENIELTQNVSGVFNFAGVTPQNLNDEITATMYAADGTTQIGEAKTFSVQSYLEKLLASSYEDSGCKTQLQYKAMKELAVNMLNYGAAAQTYANHDVDNLANANLTQDQKDLGTATITGVTSDRQVVGDKWVGAGVRFDYRLGLYFVFKADSIDGITATINDVPATPEEYVVNGVSDKCWVIRYNDFNAVNMNDVVTAKLVIGEDEQTFAYSVKSYVAAKGGASDALSALVNATYAYGYGAVAYSAEYVEQTAPTLEQSGTLTMDGKGYDFSGTDYETVTLPALNATDYTTATSKAGGSDVAPTVKTVFTSKIFETYSTSVASTDMIQINEKIYSKYDIALVNSDDFSVVWDETAGYTVKGINPTTLTFIRAWGANVTLLGEIDFQLSNTYGIQTNNSLIVGTATETADITVGNSSTTSLALWDGADLTVSAGSTLSITSAKTNAIYVDKANSHVVIDGTVNLTTTSAYGIIFKNATQTLTINEGGSLTVSGATTAGVGGYGMVTVDGTLDVTGRVAISGASKVGSQYEYGFQPRLYIRKGTATIVGQLITNSLQLGSEKDGYKGTLNFSSKGSALGANDDIGVSKTNNGINRANTGLDLYYTFANGTFNGGIASSGGLGTTLIDIRMNVADTDVSAYVNFGSGIVVTLKNGNKNIGHFIGAWTIGATTTYNTFVHKDAKFTFTSTTTNFVNYSGAIPQNFGAYGKTATVNIDGQDKEVYVSNSVYTNTVSAKTVAANFTANGDGTHSINDYTVTAGEYVSNSENTIVINGKTYTEASDGTNTIYYCAK